MSRAQESSFHLSKLGVSNSNAAKGVGGKERQQICSGTTEFVLLLPIVFLCVYSVKN